MMSPLSLPPPISDDRGVQLRGPCRYLEAIVFDIRLGAKNLISLFVN
jgi:hypothetical protein